MTYFEHFEIPLGYFVDKEKIQKKFYELSRDRHPDRFQNQSPDSLIEATQHFAMLNLALKTLKSDLDRATYLFELAGYKPEEERGNLPPDLAEDYFSLQEVLEQDALSPDEKKKAVHLFSAKITRSVAEADFKRDSIFREWESAGKPLDQSALSYFKKASSEIRQRAYLTSMAQDLEKKWPQ